VVANLAVDREFHDKFFHRGIFKLVSLFNLLSYGLTSGLGSSYVESQELHHLPGMGSEKPQWYHCCQQAPGV